MKEFDSAVIEILAANPKDMPFAALYHVEEITSRKYLSHAWGVAAEPGRRKPK
jgi:hypothetical protein